MRSSRFRSLRTAWTVSGLAFHRAGALGARPESHFHRLRRGLVRCAVWMETLGGLTRVHPQGVAVISVVPPRRRDQLRLFIVILAHDAPLATALGVAWLWWWPAAAAGAAVIAAVMRMPIM